MKNPTRLFALALSFAVFPFAHAETKVSVEVSSGSPMPAPSAPGKKGPPPWAPAHGYRAKHVYRYFPGRDVYFEPQSGNYFYLEAGAWKIGVRLPGSIKIDAAAFVEVPMDTDKPYQFHNDIKAAFPKFIPMPPAPPSPIEDGENAGAPGKGKGKGKAKGK